MKSYLLVFLAICLGVPEVKAFVLPSRSMGATQRSTMELMMYAESGSVNRREIMKYVAAASFAAPFLKVDPSSAAAKEAFPGSSRIIEGYKGLTFLLENWEKETTICNTASGECVRNPDAVRSYLGLRSTKHPLFGIEKVFVKGNSYLPDLDNADAYTEACENYQSVASLANSMAYTSVFGEYNPGGGKDMIEKYLEESKKYTIQATDSLAQIIKALELEM
uniref:Uncharacterized protein n=1 Tax=Fibrocapsa japonica TaxID=94617 RepID=A0A7S2XZ94_9STRA|mmetsp:Transcript_15132/g.22290  ORF Transcript_15132/g.22290 Transcript_15132/m.22290 type:complete len:221 (+) Transcript_15132:112-774(+)|eukprot:CAMPEP_0113943526 /NCGR_PEP_ID=MMETSP1339-20121228/25642_1 /TAXON_ID=94617 /ORGANISM="Fibrocapsa japonica" /LENGTH=220 /DNA_ID=CAMNT_0000948425 /DNA_START=112 /DNA_END=774 /DNA_ORIENTATION=+ /assembly_acc=CAM_ASM_000762